MGRIAAGRKPSGTGQYKRELGDKYRNRDHKVKCIRETVDVYGVSESDRSRQTHDLWLIGRHFLPSGRLGDDQARHGTRWCLPRLPERHVARHHVTDSERALDARIPDILSPRTVHHSATAGFAGTLAYCRPRRRQGASSGGNGPL